MRSARCLNMSALRTRRSDRPTLAPNYQLLRQRAVGTPLILTSSQGKKIEQQVRFVRIPVEQSVKPQQVWSLGHWPVMI